MADTYIEYDDMLDTIQHLHPQVRSDFEFQYVEVTFAGGRCQRCYATVDPHFQAGHAHWHKNLSLGVWLPLKVLAHIMNEMSGD